MSRDREFIENLCRVFASRNVLACLDTSDTANFQVCDDQQQVYIADGEPSKPGFRIYNPRTKKIHIFATDSCFFHERDGKRCDCIAFDDICLCFVELKLAVETRRQATDKADDARKQLGATINFFRAALNDDFMGLQLEAYLVMRDHVRPARSAQRAEVFVNFLKTYGVPLVELSDKEHKEF